MSKVPPLLKQAVLERSIAKDWRDAIKEWRVVGITLNEEDSDTCVCGHYPIKEICTITNVLTRYDLDIGNHCVLHFLKISTGNVFANIKRIRTDAAKAVTKDLLELAYENCWINDWEYTFCLDTAKRRKMTEKQIACRTRINEKILQRTKEK